MFLDVQIGTTATDQCRSVIWSMDTLIVIRSELVIYSKLLSSYGKLLIWSILAWNRVKITDQQVLWQMPPSRNSSKAGEVAAKFAQGSNGTLMSELFWVLLRACIHPH